MLTDQARLPQDKMTQALCRNNVAMPLGLKEAKELHLIRVLIVGVDPQLGLLCLTSAWLIAKLQPLASID